MPYIAPSLDLFQGKKAGDGSAVALLESAAHTPPSHIWRAGMKVLYALNISPGTAIATFRDGHYTDSSDSHAALYISQDAAGLRVLDQGDGYVASESQIAANGMPDDASHYYVIE